MAGGGFRFAAREAEVVVDAGEAELEHAEAFADGIGGAEAAEGGGELAGGDAEDLDVEVLRRTTGEPVAHAAADEQRPADRAHGV